MTGEERAGVPPEGSSAPGCVGPEVWFRVCTGDMPQHATELLLSHAAECVRCGRLLREASEILRDDAKHDELEEISGLQSAKEGWQVQLANQLQVAGAKPKSPTAEDRLREETGTARNPRQRTEDHRKMRWTMRPLILGGLAALAVVAAITATAIWVTVQHRARARVSADTLLAQAYVEKRTIALRIGSTPYVPLRLERGSDTAKDRRMRPLLLEAEAEAAQQLSVHPDSVTWLQAFGRTDLLEHETDPPTEAAEAVVLLEEAHGLDSGNLSVVVDLASAYILRGERSTPPNKSDFGKAVELLGEVLAKEPANEVAQFNDAIALEKLGTKAQAVNEWRQFLKSHPSSPWAAEARARMEQVSEEVNQSRKRGDAELQTLHSVAMVLQNQNGESVDEIDSRIEVYLDVALQKWLLAYISPETQDLYARTDLESALRGFAVLEVKGHRDHWLEEVIAAKPGRSSALADAIRRLIRAEQEIQSSEDATAATELRGALVGFSKADLAAGVFRSRFDQAMIAQLAHERNQCEVLARENLSDRRLQRYPWVKIESEIEEAVCLPDSDPRALSSAREAEADARRYGYPNLGMRALNSESAIESERGNHSRAWELAAEGLADFWAGSFPRLRGYNVLATMYQLAEEQSQCQLEVVVEREGLPLIASHPNIAMRAYAEDRLGQALLCSGQAGGASDAFREAHHIFMSLPAGARRDALSAEAQIYEARAEEARGDASGALSMLLPLRQGALRFLDPDLQREYYEVSGIAEARTGHYDLAEKDLRLALDLTEREMSLAATRSDRWKWSRENETIYREIVTLKLKSDPSQALMYWERFKGAGPVGARTHQPDMLELSSALSHFPPETALVTYFAGKRGVTAWVWDSKKLHRTEIPEDGDRLAVSVNRFLEYCADPASNLSMLQAQSSQLYQLLIAPVEPYLTGYRHLIIEPDGALRLLPFEILKNPQGRYLGEIFDLSFSAGTAYTAQFNHWSRVDESWRAVVIKATEIPGSEPLSDVEDETTEVTRLFRRAKVLTMAELSKPGAISDLAWAQVIHFSGHGIASTQSAGLLVGESLTLPYWGAADGTPMSNRLVVLAACSTSRGTTGFFDDEDSLVRRLAGGGVSEVVASRWMVDSTATALLMKTFYEQLFAGKSVAAALTAARISMRGTPEYAHPFYWAGFSVFGRG